MSITTHKLLPLLAICGATLSVPGHAHDWLSHQTVTSSPDITFTTWNIMASRLTKTSNLVNALPALESDIIALQEVDFNTQRSAKNAGSDKPVNQAELLARGGKMDVATCKSIDFEGGQYGTALLSRWEITKTEQISLSNDEGSEQRTACVNTINVPGLPAPLAIIITHPDQNRDNKLRLKQVRELMALVDSTGKTAIPVLMGDLNLVPASPEYRELTYQMKDTLPTAGHFTYPGWNPNRRIDYILTSTAQEWKVKDAIIPQANKQWREINWSQLSDHLPVMIKMSLTEL